MALRFGEMVLVVRTQDFASRNLHRVAGELHSLSREQRALNAVQQHNMRITRAQDRISDLRTDQKRLRIVQDSARANNRLAAASAAVARAQAKVKSTQGSVVAPGGGTLPLAGHTDNLRKLDAVEKRLARATAAATAFDAALGKMPNRFRRMTMDLGATSDALTKNQRALRDARIAEKMLAQESAALLFATQKSTLRLEKMLTVGHAMGRIGRVLQLTGLAGTAAMGLMAKSAADFDTNLALAATQARDIDAPMAQVAVRSKQIGDAILKMMQKYPASQKEMADAAYEVFSSLNLEENGVINVGKGLKFLETANKAAVAGQGTLADSTNAMITLMNDFSQENPAELFDTMFDIIRFGKMHMAEFNNMLGDVAPAAKGAGLTLENVSGAMAYLTQVLPKTSRAGVGLRRFIDIFQDPLVIQGLKDWNVEVERMGGGMVPLPKLVKDIVKAFPGLKTGQLSVTKFLTDITKEGKVPGKRVGKGAGKQFTAQGRIAATFLFQNADEYLIRQRQILQNDKEFNKSYMALMASRGNQWKVSVNQMRALVIIIGQEVLPIFLKILDYVAKLAQWFQNLSPRTRHLIAEFAALAAVGALVIGVLGSIAGAILSLYAVVKLFTKRWLFMRAAMAATSAGAGGGGAGMFANVAAMATVAAKRIGWVYAAYLAYKLLTDKPTRNNLWDDITSGRPGEGIVNFLAPGNPGTAAMKWLTKKGVGDSKEMVIDRLMDRSGMSGKSLKKAHDDFLKLGMDERVRVIKEWGSWGMKDELLHRLSMGSVKEALAGAIKGDGTTASIQKEYQKILKGLNLKDMTDDQKKAMEEYNKLMGQLTDTTGETAAKTKELADAMKSAWDQEFEAATDRLKTAAEAMSSKFVELRGKNETAWGELFKGPVLTSETFNIAKEWGINPGLRNINQDIDATNKRFTQFRGNLDKLRKKGVPQEVIDEIMSMGAEEGMAWTQAILKGTPAEFRKFITLLKQRKADIQKATEVDFNRLRNHWMQAGKLSADAFITALNDPNHGLTSFFENWITGTFPAYATSAANAAAAAARKAFIENNPDVTVTPKNTVVPKGTGGDKNGSTGTAKGKPFVGKFDRQYQAWMAKNHPNVDLNKERPMYNWKGIFSLMRKFKPGELDPANKKLIFDMMRTQYSLKDPKWKKGMIEEGNLDILHRPRVRNKDGSVSSVKSASFGIDGMQVLLPKVWQGLNRIATNAEALAHYKKTGEHLGKFKTIAEANAYAEALHRQQAQLAANANAAAAANKKNPAKAEPRTTQSTSGPVTNNYDYSTTIEVKGTFQNKEAAKDSARKIAFALKNRRTPQQTGSRR